MSSREDRLEAMRHSAAHVMAQAVKEIFPDAQFGIGPTIENGFYYDFDLPRPLTPADLEAIEARMRETIASDTPFVQEFLNKTAAQEVFASQPYKLELIREIPDEEVSIYTQGPFTDLCRGPHVESTGKIGAFKLLNVAGAYWRGDEHRPMLQRIYGAAFDSPEELAQYLHRIEEASRRDHRRLGKDLDLFSFHEEAGPGLVYWHPKGSIIRHVIEEFWKKEHLSRGYELVYSPHVAKADLWRISGHLDFYRENMYSPMDVEGQEYILKPMNCPGHILMYKTRLRSYRELPLRWAELGTVYRYERSGVLHGLTRVRGFTQDDAHLFCRPDQLEDEIVGVLDLTRFMMTTFGFKEYEILLSTRPEKYAGTDELWNLATQTLERALRHLDMSYSVDPGGGVFYGPKIDIKLKDALGRLWQGPTTQLDFNLPQAFDMTYIAEDGTPQRPVMIHRTVLGSMERFLGCLIEHYAGTFPTWLAPVQAVIIPITDRHLDYARRLEVDLKLKGIRTELDARNERMNAKIRDAQLQKTPYMIIVGDNEVSNGTVSVRRRSGQQTQGQAWAEFVSSLQAVVEQRSLD